MRSGAASRRVPGGDRGGPFPGQRRREVPHPGFHRQRRGHHHPHPIHSGLHLRGHVAYQVLVRAAPAPHVLRLVLGRLQAGLRSGVHAFAQPYSRGRALRQRLG